MYTKAFEEYIFLLLDDLRQDLMIVGGNGIRFTAHTIEPGYWIAYNGFDFSKTEKKKLSATTSPVISFAHLGSSEPFVSFIVLDLTASKNFLAVSYTASLEEEYIFYEDPIAGDYVFPEEMEIAFYRNELETKISIDKITYARLMRSERWIPESIYYAHRSFCYRIHHKVYARYHYSLIRKRSNLIKILALLYLNNRDRRFTLDFSVAWDKYWEELGMLSTKPRYDRVFRHPGYKEPYSLSQLDEDVFPYNFYTFAKRRCMIPEEVVDELTKHVYEECFYILNLLEGEMPEAPSEQVEERKSIYPTWAYEIYYMHPDIFSSPDDVMKLIRSNPLINVNDLLSYSQTIALLRRIKSEVLQGKVMKPEWDSEVIIES